ncbi:uncharacterized protein MELLADRAFT_124206 [Melampsora larici-populina 98AG31]|uniref:Secreted protein n=1 Tax=Melampsora larici-populina (strain 98AG31 / pathotype 3-4-7) TaxID=747676 RepID=F4RGY5_MELLP|nr:uncharacterized protein MELLADRAFT_124206 [Melampsora larici-populina 98AG31]EGG08403.1 secreted protein [Melampsora larici-populina 98AG31]
MRNPPYSHIKWIILVWVIVNLKVFVIGRPAMGAGKYMQDLEYVKGVGTAGNANKSSLDVKVAHGPSLPKPDDLRPSVDLGPSKSGSGAVEIAGSMRKGRVPHTPNTLQTGSKDLQVAHDFLSTKPDGNEALNKVPPFSDLIAQITRLCGFLGLQTSMFYLRPQIGSWFAKIRGFMRKFWGADPSLAEAPHASFKFEETRGLAEKEIREDLLRFTPTARAEKAAPLVPELDEAFKNQNIMLFRGQMEDIKPVEVAKLSPDRLIRYAADRNEDVEGMARNLYKASEKYTQAEQKAFYKASLGYSQVIDPSLILNKKASAKKFEETKKMIQDIVQQKMKESNIKGISENDMTMSIRESFINKIAVLYPEVEKGLQELKKAKAAYEQVYAGTYQAAYQLSNADTLEPQAFTQLTDKQYVEKAAFYDIKAYQRYAQWSDAEKRLDDVLYDQELVATLERKFETATQDKEINKIADQLKEDLKAKGKPIDGKTVHAVARSKFIKKQASLDPFLRQYVSRIKSTEKQVENTKNAALRGADRYYKSHKLLKSAALRYKSWFFRNIIQKFFSWLFIV